MNKIRSGAYEAIVSPVHFKEVEAIPDSRTRIEVLRLLRRFPCCESYSMADIRVRAERLADLRFGVADAAHVALAERFADAFITCDDDLEKKCGKHGVKVSVYNPAAFVLDEGLK